MRLEKECEKRSEKRERESREGVRVEKECLLRREEVRAENQCD